MHTYTIDAQGKKLGRVASQAAAYLMGKNRVDFVRSKAPTVTIEITNASKLSLTEKKKADTVYKSYSGYQGGLKIEDLGALAARRGYRESLRRAIRGMLPNNKLRPGMLKRLKIYD